MKKLLAEFLGTSFISMAVIGSAFMANSLSEDGLLKLLVNAIATTMALLVAISIFASISGAHFNPVVTISLALEKRINTSEVIPFIIAQISGALFGVLLANLMFQDSLIRISSVDRADPNNYLGELIATAVLVLLILISLAQGRAHAIAYLVPAWIGSAYFATISTSFANPAVTFARAFSDIGAGINLSSMGIFIIVQLLGGGLGVVTARFFSRK